MSIEQAMIYIGYFAVIAGAIKAVQFLFSITPTGKLEKQVKDNTEHLERDFKHLERIDNRLDGIEKKFLDFESQHEKELEELNNSLSILGSSLAAMLNHMVDGNGIDKLKEERDKLLAFFITNK